LGKALEWLPPGVGKGLNSGTLEILSGPLKARL
jgi:hypothetical protein